MARVALMFPGQGSQFVGMAKEFHQSWPRARELFELASEVSGLDLARLCFEGPLDELTQTINLQPAVTLVDLICGEAFLTAGPAPLAVAGHSLGEYPALCLAGILSPRDTLDLVSRRGRLMDRDAAAHPGAMSAVVGASPAEVAQICAEVDGVVQPANFNTPVQTVITGASEAVAEAGRLAAAKGLKAIPLKVSGAWHSPFMQEAAQDLAPFIAGASFAPPTCLHVPNTTGRPSRDAAEIQKELAGQLTSPVLWVQTVESLVAQGVEIFVEAGPGRVLAGLLKKTVPAGVKVLGFQDPAGLEQVLASIS
ncbi:MAG: ACP S-malonyltransferase [Deltaproteobacteria bacterium]|nr:ACP S-malonyltransferase [Deltaproteobacteria bacterium]